MPLLKHDDSGRQAQAAGDAWPRTCGHALHYGPRALRSPDAATDAVSPVGLAMHARRPPWHAVSRAEGAAATLILYERTAQTHCRPLPGRGWGCRGRSSALVPCVFKGKSLLVCGSAHVQYLVTADDDGMVKLFNYPVVVDDAPHRAYRGHCSHVMGVRFNMDDSLVRAHTHIACRVCAC